MKFLKLSFLIRMSLLTLSLCCFFPLMGEVEKKHSPSTELQDQEDETDIYAIPFDDSEAEDEAEEEYLREYEKKK